MAEGSEGRKLPPGITRRANGLYMGRVMYKGVSHAIYDRNLGELKKRMTELRYSLEHGTYVKKSAITFDDWFGEWITTYKQNTVKQGTVDLYNKHYSAYIKKYLGDMKLVDIQAQDLQKLLNNMSSEGYADDTITLTYCVLSGVFKQAYKNELIPKNPFSLITRPKGKAKKEKVVFTKKQQELYMRYAERSYLRNLLQLAMCTGMRNGELRGLLWSDVDFKRKVIHIRHNLITSSKDGVKMDTPKTRTSTRDIPMTEKVYEILKRQESEGEKNKDDFVFYAANGPVSRKRITHEINVMLQNMADDGIAFPYFTLHSTRHTFATRCIEKGMNPQVLKTILGHATLSMTMDLYSHVLPDTKAVEMRKVSKAF